MFNRPVPSRKASPASGVQARPRALSGGMLPGTGKGGMEFTGRIKARPSHTHGKSKTRSRPA